MMPSRSLAPAVLVALVMLTSADAPSSTLRPASIEMPLGADAAAGVIASRNDAVLRPGLSAGALPTLATALAAPPAPAGYFPLVPPGDWSSLPTGRTCKSLVHDSTWEPRPGNAKRNHAMPNPEAVHDSLAARPRARDGAYDARWDTWLLPRVSGQFAGTTDEIFQWAACKWGLRDNLLRAIAVRESMWYQYETYPSGRCVIHFGCGDLFAQATSASMVYCRAIAPYGRDYQKDYGPGICPKTFSIVGVMDWQDPEWGPYPDNQNGTFPFNRDSTAFAVDYLAAHLRGCYEGWESWLDNTGTEKYARGDLWGCVGAWYAGGWHSAAADGYIDRVRHEYKSKPWLEPGWPDERPPCTKYGCPGSDPPTPRSSNSR
jgi:hypothetical protein